MSRRPNYIPSTIADFNKFQGDLLAAVTANAPAWGITAAQLAEFTQWSADYAVHYANVSVKAKRSTEGLDNYKAFLIGYVAYLRALVQGYLVNNTLIPIGTRGSLGLNPRGLSPRQPKEKINTVPIVTLIPMGGGLLRFNFKVDAASKIAKMHPDSNGLAIYYRFSTIGRPVPPPPAPAEGLGMAVSEEGDDPMNRETADRAENGMPTAEGYELYVSTRAQFTRQFALEDIGKLLHVYARWINSSKPENNGNFSMVTSILIS